MKFRLKPFLAALVMVLVTVAALELLVAAVDPWGLHYFDDLKQMYAAFEADAQRGYRLPDGVYHFRDWRATMADGTRLVPDTDEAAPCELALLGDSVAFGYGVNDADTWANLAAADLPGVRLVNTGMVGYNSANVLGTWQHFPEADAYVYLMNANDRDETLTVDELHAQAERRPMLWLSRYMSFALRGAGAAPLTADAAHLYRDLDRMTQDERLQLVIVQDNPLAADLRDRGYVFRVIPGFTHPISRVDSHPSAAGNRDLAQHMLPILRDTARRFCASA